MVLYLLTSHCALSRGNSNFQRPLITLLLYIAMVVFLHIFTLPVALSSLHTTNPSACIKYSCTQGSKITHPSTYTGQVKVFLRRRGNGIIGVDNRYDVESKELRQCASKVPAA